MFDIFRNVIIDNDVVIVVVDFVVVNFNKVFDVISFDYVFRKLRNYRRSKNSQFRCRR